MTCRKRYSNRFRDNNKGDVAIVFGVMAVVLVLIIGGAVDLGRWLHTRNHTISAMDSAVLAGGRSLQVNPTDRAGAVAVAKAFYIQNNQSRFTVVNDTIKFAVGDDGQSVVSTGNAYVTTPFLGLINIHVLPVLDEAGHEHPKSEFGVGGRQKLDLEVSLMLDVTASMKGAKLDDLRAAAKDLINIIVDEDQSQSKSRVAIIPTSEGVRVPPAALSRATGVREDILRVTKSHTHPYFGQTMINRTYYLTDCAAERIGSEAFTDASPGPGGYVQSIYSEFQAYECVPERVNEMMPLSDDKAALKAKIEDLVSGGQAAMKQSGVVIFTIGFDLEDDAPARAALADCASDVSKALTAEDGNNLQQAFRAVAL